MTIINSFLLLLCYYVFFIIITTLVHQSHVEDRLILTIQTLNPQRHAPPASLRIQTTYTAYHWHGISGHEGVLSTGGRLHPNIPVLMSTCKHQLTWTWTHSQSKYHKHKTQANRVWRRQLIASKSLGSLWSTFCFRCNFMDVLLIS